MEWIVAQPWSNGRVFMTGASAMGNAVFAAGLYEPQWLEAITPTIATGFGHQTTFPGGAFHQSLVAYWLAVLGYRDVIDEIFEHEVRRRPGPRRGVPRTRRRVADAAPARALGAVHAVTPGQ